jgi:hypothetical protein
MTGKVLQSIFERCTWLEEEWQEGGLYIPRILHCVHHLICHMLITNTSSDSNASERRAVVWILKVRPKAQVLRGRSAACGALRGSGSIRRWGPVGGSWFMQVCPWRGNWDPEPLLSLFASWLPWNEQDFLATHSLHDVQSNRAQQAWTEILQNQVPKSTFPPLKWIISGILSQWWKAD